ncbi:MAG: 3-hydroxyisobutyrate dehydrogenase [Acidimicrobiaceae bacterium]|nr:3-hydroxyisobutyrate dehydrogenase [Acidimicrobiaceae bacterium]
MKVCVLGTGTMGSALAANLCRAGFDTTVWDRTPARLVPLAARGASIASSPAEAVVGADVVITMLPDADAVVSVVDQKGALEAFGPDSIWVQMGTIGLAATDWMRTITASRRPDVSFVDAPVSGSKGPAEEGALLILASGPANARDRLEPVFAALGRRTIWLGDAGRGMRLKLVLNTWLAFLMEGVAEVAAVADELGITLAELADGLEGGPLATPAAMAKLRKIANRDFQEEFALSLALKDVDLALGALASHPPALTAISEQWHVAAEAGLGDLDVSAARLALTPLASPGFAARGG